MKETNNISKDKFVLVQSDKIIYDEQFQTKSIGYYQDAWNRFKKNKASITATIILVIILLMSIIGPHLRGYTLTENSSSRKWTDRISDMPPKIKGLGWLGFDGEKELTGFKARFDRLPDGIVVGEYSKENAVGQVTVKVDYYKYVDYMN